jgi:uncharacterized membrane protein (Fun14 family)
MITEPLSWGNSYQYFLAHLVGMPSWHKAVLLVAALVCGSGAFGSIASRSSATTQSVISTTAPSDDSAASDSMFGRISPHMIRIGASIVIGFVVGWYMRAFVKTVIFLGLIIVGCVWLASHFGLFHVTQGDVDTVRQRGVEAARYVEAHAETWKDWVVHKLPSAGGGTIGAWLGFKRR